MFKFEEIHDGIAIFRYGERKACRSRRDVALRIDVLEIERNLPFVTGRAKQELQEELFQFKCAQAAFENLDSAPQAPSSPKSVSVSEAFARSAGLLSGRGERRSEGLRRVQSCDEVTPDSLSRKVVSERPGVQFLRVAMETRGGVHAEGVFCAAGARPSQVQKDYLTAAQIRERMEGMTKRHPDRAVYERALKGVEARNVELQAPIRLPG